MTSQVNVDLGDRSYVITVGSGLRHNLGVMCKSWGVGKRCLLVSDSNVAPFYAEACKISLQDQGFEVFDVVIPAGEASKCHDQLHFLYEAAFAAGLDRKSFAIALGGGVVGDLTGYFAATFLRGIKYIQMPTSLLAMVDSSVGGKTGINVKQGKNLIGAFYQPIGVIADLETLYTLEEEEYVSGLAEVVKHGVIHDAEFFSSLESQVDDILERDPAVLAKVIVRNCEIKSEVVQADEREAGLREILNFGHTLGHAVEKLSGYGHYLHGQAVAIGMGYAALLSVKLAGLAQDDCERIFSLMSNMGLPIKVPDVEWNDVLAAMRLDKKARNDIPRFVLAEHLGHAKPGFQVPVNLLKEVWDGCCQ